MPFRREHEVRRFQIPMDYVVLMCCFKSLGNLPGFFPVHPLEHVVDHEKVRVSELAPGPGLRSLDLES